MGLKIPSTCLLVNMYTFLLSVCARSHTHLEMEFLGLIRSVLNCDFENCEKFRRHHSKKLEMSVSRTQERDLIWESSLYS